MKTLSAAVASALLFSNAYAAGLGKLTVLSALGQPLRAEIELTSVSKDEVGALTAKLASMDAFKQASIDFNPALMGLQFAIQQRGDRQFIRVTSSQAMNEPFVDMLLELAGPNGRLVREYTFLLDPADLRTAQSAQVAPAPVASQADRSAQTPVQSQSVPQVSSTTQATPAPRARTSEAVPRPARPATQAAPAAEGAGEGGEYRVRNGDSLARIANQVRSGGVSLDQMLVALYQNNPDAFVGNNMNRLKSGQILTVPSAEAARGINSAEARSIVVAQAADFNAYRNKLAGQVASSAAQKSAEAKQSAGGKITAKVEERPTPASESKDKLKLSAAQAAAAGAAAKAATAEDKIAADKAIAEANARVKELEKNVTELQKLLEVKNKALADQQKQADLAKADASKAEAAKAEAAKAEAAKAEAAKAEAVKAEALKAEAAQAEAARQQAAQAQAAAAKPAEPAAEKPATPPAPPVAKAKPVTPPPPPAPEPSFLDEVMENPLVLPGLGALLVALGALGIYRARRQKQGKQFEDSIISDSSLKANSLFGSTGGQSVDTNNSVFNSSFSPSASQLDTNEVDPVAEADVYIAYGRDAQAEEILKEALRTQPDRLAVRVKLLEIYSNRKDLRAFEVLATELYGLTKGEGEEWAQAATMGAAIDPTNPLYASGKKEATDATGTLVAPTQPLDEQGLATLLSTTQPDTNALETIGPLDTDSSYFGNTAMATEAPLEPVPEAEQEPKAKDDEVHELSSNDLDFDLDGMQDMAVPNTIPRPAPAEPPAELASIDFDFLDEPKAKTEEPAVEELAAAPEADVLAELAPPPEPEPAESASSVPDLAFSLDEKTAEPQVSNDISLDIGLPEAEEKPLDVSVPDIAEAAPAEATAAHSPMDFDLSDISLELNPPASAAAEPEMANAGMNEAEAVPDLEFEPQEEFAVEAEASSNSAEMATKLDLAIAYQEIGDKEGARELLDEVMKGGTPEQSERAKNLLLELA